MNSFLDSWFYEDNWEGEIVIFSSFVIFLQLDKFFLKYSTFLNDTFYYNLNNKVFRFILNSDINFNEIALLLSYLVVMILTTIKIQ